MQMHNTHTRNKKRKHPRELEAQTYEHKNAKSILTHWPGRIVHTMPNKYKLT